MSPLRLPATKANKYRAKRTHLDGVVFDSKAEAQRYGVLKMLERAGKIVQLERQPVFLLLVTPRHVKARIQQAAARMRGGVLDDSVQVGLYRADFRYRESESMALVVEDVKGVDTPLSRWKRKHVAAQYGVTVQLVRKRPRGKRVRR